MRAPFMAGEFPVPGQVRLCRRRRDRGRSGRPGRPHRVCASSAPDPVRSFRPRRDPAARGVPPSRAVLAANMETALNAVWDAAPGPCGRIAVVGAGVVGALVGFHLRAASTDADVTLIDINPAAGGTGARARARASPCPTAAPEDCDFVFHASATAGGLATALDLAGDEATIVELSWYGAGDVAVPLGGAFHSRRLKLISSQVGKVAPSHRATLDATASGSKQRSSSPPHPHLDALLAPPIAFGDLPARLPDILQPKSGVLCQLISLSLRGSLVHRRSPRPHHDRPFVSRRGVRARRRRCMARPSWSMRHSSPMRSTATASWSTSAARTRRSKACSSR